MSNLRTPVAVGANRDLGVADSNLPLVTRAASFSPKIHFVKPPLLHSREAPAGFGGVFPPWGRAQLPAEPLGFPREGHGVAAVTLGSLPIQAVLSSSCQSPVLGDSRWIRGSNSLRTRWHLVSLSSRDKKGQDQNPGCQPRDYLHSPKLCSLGKHSGGEESSSDLWKIQWNGVKNTTSCQGKDISIRVDFKPKFPKNK